MTETLTLAFADDPVWGRGRWAFPDRQHASEQQRVFFELLLTGAHRYRWVRVTEHCEAVASWTPPGGTELTKKEEERLVSILEEMLGDHASVLLEGFALFRRFTPSRGAPLSPEPARNPRRPTGAWSWHGVASREPCSDRRRGDAQLS